MSDSISNTLNVQ